MDPGANDSSPAPLRSRVGRRRLLVAGLTTAATGLAGCLDENQSDDLASRSTATTAPTTAAANPPADSTTAATTAPGRDVGAGTWPTVFADARNTNVVAQQQGLDQPLTSLWSVDMGRFLTAPPVVANGLVILGTNPDLDASEPPKLAAFDARTGIQKWALELNAHAERCPAIDGDTVYVTDNVNHAGHLYAVDVASGGLQWQREQDPGDQTAITYADGTLYFAREETAYAVAAADGTSNWKQDTLNRLTSPFAVGDGRVFASYSDPVHPGGIRVFDAASGRPEWGYRMEAAEDVDDDTDYTPAATVRGAVVYYAASHARSIVALAAADGTEQWAVPTQTTALASPTVTADRVVIGDGPTVRALDRSTGTEQWAHESTAIPTTPTVAGDAVLLTTLDGTIEVLDLATGTVRWSQSTDARFTTPPVLADGRMFVGTSDGRLQAFGPSDLQPSRTPTTTTPTTTSTTPVRDRYTDDFERSSLGDDYHKYWRRGIEITADRAVEGQRSLELRSIEEPSTPAVRTTLRVRGQSTVSVAFNRVEDEGSEHSGTDIHFGIIDPINRIATVPQLTLRVTRRGDSSGSLVVHEANEEGSIVVDREVPGEVPIGHWTRAGLSIGDQSVTVRVDGNETTLSTAQDWSDRDVYVLLGVRDSGEYSGIVGGFDDLQVRPK